MCPQSNWKRIRYQKARWGSLFGTVGLALTAALVFAVSVSPWVSERASADVFGNGIDGARTYAGNTTDAPMDSSASGMEGTFTIAASSILCYGAEDPNPSIEGKWCGHLGSQRDTVLFRRRDRHRERAGEYLH